jgi:hypothetical protein
MAAIRGKKSGFAFCVATLSAARSTQKLRSRGGFETGFPLTHMNRHNNQPAGKTKTKP